MTCLTVERAEKVLPKAISGAIDILMGGRRSVPEGPLKITRQFTGGNTR